VIVDHDAAIDGNAGLARQRDVRPDARGEDHRIGLDPAAIGQLNPFDMGLAVNSCGIGIEQNLNAFALDERFQQFTGGYIELTLHQPVHQMQQRHRRAGFGEAIGGFQSQ